jgi:protein-tyrosine-phosphatase
MKKKLILFICTGNTCRSPMAKALFEAGLTDEELEQYEARSFGLAAFGGEPASDYSIEVMEEYGIDISSHRSTPLNRYALAEAELVVCMTEAHSRVLLQVGVSPEKLVIFEIPDPFKGTYLEYRRCAAAIKTEMKKVYDRIRK